MNTPNKPKRRRDLFFGAVVSFLVVLAVVWFGSGPAWAAKPPVAPTVTPPTVTPFPTDPDTYQTADPEDTHPKPKEKLPDVLPQLQDEPQPHTPDAITQPIEVVAPNPNIQHLVKIPGGGGGGPGLQVFNVDGVDEAPVPKYRARPAYPNQARLDGHSGVVWVDFIVDTSGDVRNAFAVRSSMREFEDSAVAAVGKWKFQPGMKGGRAVLTHMQVPIVFSLSEGN
jgi:periplasmic protein TonB